MSNSSYVRVSVVISFPGRSVAFGNRFRRYSSSASKPSVSEVAPETVIAEAIEAPSLFENVMPAFRQWDRLSTYESMLGYRKTNAVTRSICGPLAVVPESSHPAHAWFGYQRPHQGRCATAVDLQVPKRGSSREKTQKSQKEKRGMFLEIPFAFFALFAAIPFSRANSKAGRRATQTLFRLSGQPRRSQGAPD